MMRLTLAYLINFLVLIAATSSSVTSSVDDDDLTSIDTNPALVDDKSSINSGGPLTTVSNGGSVSFEDLAKGKDQSLLSAVKQAQSRIRRRANLISSSSRLHEVADLVQSSVQDKVRNRNRKSKRKKIKRKKKCKKLANKGSYDTLNAAPNEDCEPDYEQDSDDPSGVTFLPHTKGLLWGKIARMLLTKRHFNPICNAINEALGIQKHQCGFWGPDAYGYLPSTGSAREMWIKFHIKQHEYGKDWYCTVHFTNVKRVGLGVRGERLDRLKCTDKMLHRIVGQLKNGQFSAKVDKTSKVLSSLGIQKTKDSKNEWL